MKKKFFCIAIVSATLLFDPLSVSCQYTRDQVNIRKQMPPELPDNKYLAPPSGQISTSSPQRFKSSGIMTVQVNVDANGQNIVGDAANEPSIAVDPVHPERMAIGWRQFDNVFSNFRQAGYAYTTNAGENWTFPGNIEAGIFRSDPVLDCDANGNFYYNSLTSTVNNDFFCKVFRSSDGGTSWDEGVDAHGGDKQWMAIDKSGGQGMGNIYASWNSSYSSCAPGFFTRSIDGGNNYEDCIAVEGNPYWGTMAVGLDGELYIAGRGEWSGLVVAKSSTVQFPGPAAGWDFSTQVDIDGFLLSQSDINPAGLIGQAYIDVDRSDGPGRGNVYVLASVARLSNPDPADVMFSRSSDGGLTWSSPVRINDDPGISRYQWFGTMSVAPNGRIDVIWLDTRDASPADHVSEHYYSWSIDQGLTWSTNEKLSALFNPHVGYPQQDKMGDYFDMKSDNTGANLAWANTLNGEQDVYYSYIIPHIDGIPVSQYDLTGLKLSNSPNPFKDQTIIHYTLPDDGMTSLVIFDLYGKEISTLLNKNQKAGAYSYIFSEKSLPSGFYLCRLNSAGLSKTIRLMKIN